MIFAVMMVVGDYRGYLVVMGGDGKDWMVMGLMGGEEVG